MGRFAFLLSLLYITAPALSSLAATPRVLTTSTGSSVEASPPAQSPFVVAAAAVPAPTIIVAPSPDSSAATTTSTAYAAASGAAAPTQRPSGLFNSYTCVAIKPYLVCGIVTWKTMNCTAVMEEYEFLAGNCCPLNDYGTSGCRLEVNGPNSFCSYKTRFDRRYYSYLIAPSNTGACLASQYRVSLPPTPPPTMQPKSAVSSQSKYAACFHSSYVSCAGATCAGTTSTTSSPYAFRKAYSRCSRYSPTKSLRCVSQASTQCASQAGRPPVAMCEALPSVGASGKLGGTTCVRLRRKCRAAPETVACA